MLATVIGKSDYREGTFTDRRTGREINYSGRKLCFSFPDPAIQHGQRTREVSIGRNVSELDGINPGDTIEIEIGFGDRITGITKI